MSTPADEHPITADAIVTRTQRFVRAYVHLPAHEACWELRTLAAEATAMANNMPQRETPVERRQRIAAERAPSGRGLEHRYRLV
jgi:hypothetical protein